NPTGICQPIGSSSKLLYLSLRTARYSSIHSNLKLSVTPQSIRRNFDRCHRTTLEAA
ncbi:MAG: hypothetical protein MHMPM18_002331, partial [Marteilia pararefringens]